jgi:hypothetical protein
MDTVLSAHATLPYFTQATSHKSLELKVARTGHQQKYVPEHVKGSP